MHNSLRSLGIKCKSEKATLLIRDVRFDCSLFLLSYLNDFNVCSKKNNFRLAFIVHVGRTCVLAGDRC